MKSEQEMSMEEMSGERGYNRPPQLILNEIRINGNKGKFIYRDVKAGLVEANGKKKYPERELPEAIEVVFLKVRRRLVQFRKGQKNLTTNEHNHKGQVVTLFGADSGVEKEVAADLREKYQGLRTQQIVYALYNNELVRLIIRGASLGSQVKPKEEHDFYSYISSFKDEGKDEHFYEHVTELYALQEEGELGSYYCIGFRQGRKLEDPEMDIVKENMKVAFNYCTAVDEFFGQDAEKIQKATAKEQLPTVEYPEEDIAPEDIPF